MLLFLLLMMLLLLSQAEESIGFHAKKSFSCPGKEECIDDLEKSGLLAV